MRVFLGVKVLIGLCAGVALAALAAVAADALLILSDPVRAAAAWALGAVAIAVLVWGIRTFRRLSEHGVARTLETGSPILGTSLTNAVQLAQHDFEIPSTEVLRRQAVEYGRGKALPLRTWPAAKRGVLAFLAASVAAALLWTGALLIFPQVFDAVLPRYTDPYGDHPPYSRLVIQAEPPKAEVLYGGQCEVRAVTTGAPVEKLYLVAENSKGATDTVMFRRPDQSYSQTLTNLRENTRFWVTDGRARSLRHDIRVRFTPLITFLEVKTTFPEYTKLRAQTRKLTESSVEVPKKTVLTFRAGSNRPLASGTLELTPILGGEKKVLRMTPEKEDKQVVTGSFPVEEAVVFSISLSDVDGLASRENRQGRVTIRPDMRPRIFVLEPGRHAVATPDVSIPVRVRAEDDYAVDHVVWFRGLNRSIERPVEMKAIAHTGPGTVEARGEFALKDLGMKPGDTIEYFFEARDNYPEGPNITTSRIYSLQIISLEQYQEILRRLAAQRALFQQYLSLDNHLRRTFERAQAAQEKRRELAKKGKPSDDEAAKLRKNLQDLRLALGDYRKGLNEAVATSPLFDIEKAFKESLAKQGRTVDRLTKQLDDMMQEAGSNGLVDPAQLDKLVDELSGLFTDMTKNVGEPVRLITSVIRLIAYADEFTRLAQQQKETAGLARRFKDQKEELTRTQQMELQEIAAIERQVRDGLQRFVETLPELVAKVPDEEAFQRLKETAREFLKKVADAQIQPDLDKATDKFASLDGRGGYPPAQDAADKMMALVAKLESVDLPGMGQACLVFQPALSGGLGNTLKQILSAMGGGINGSGVGGYGLMGEGVGLYGPDQQLAGSQDEDMGMPRGESTSAPRHDDARDNAADRDLPQAKEGRVRLERNAKFPLRYRDLVGEYFRIVAESQGQ